METNPHTQARSLLFYHFGFGSEFSGAPEFRRLWPGDPWSWALLGLRAELAAAAFLPLPRFMSRDKGCVAAASCISKWDYTALFLCFLPSFLWRS